MVDSSNTLAIVVVAVLASCGTTVEQGGGGAGGGVGGAVTSSTTVATGTGGGGSTGGGCGGSCDPECGFWCCGGVCVNRSNDPFNCGACGKTCAPGAPFCRDGDCQQPPCSASCEDPAKCCGGMCCGAGQRCCAADDTSPYLACENIVPGGTCSLGCPCCTCASPDTPVDTPSGPVAIAALRPGDIVYSAERGAVVAAVVSEVRSRAAADAQLIVVTLANGGVLEMSDRHPTADGRPFGELRAGDRLDGVMVTRVERRAHAASRTYDIRTATPSGAYYAAGVLVGSTLIDARCGSAP